jgi:hypothetical protein
MRLKLTAVAVVAALAVLALTNPVVAQTAKKITGKNIKDSSVTTKDIRNGSLRSADFAPGQLPAGPPGPAGPAASATIPVGTTVTGVLAYDTTTNTQDVDEVLHVDLPGKARTALSDGTVNFAPDNAGFATNDDDATCTGTFAAPTAPAGKVCIYARSASAFALVSGGVAFADDIWAKSGFDVTFKTNSDSSHVFFDASWAYTS